MVFANGLNSILVSSPDENPFLLYHFMQAGFHIYNRSSKINQENSRQSSRMQCMESRGMQHPPVKGKSLNDSKMKTFFKNTTEILSMNLN